MSVDVVVIGSANIDLVMRVSRYPRPGETVTAERAGEFPGGKGLNQAVTASRRAPGEPSSVPSAATGTERCSTT